MEARIDELYDAIAPDAEADNAMWQNWGVFQDLPEAVRALREDYLVERRRFVYSSWMGETGGPLPVPVEPFVIIDEADPSPGAPQEAYVRLANLSGGSVDVSAWRVAGAGVDLRLEPGAVLTTNGFLYVVADVQGFLARDRPPHGGQSLFVLGNWRGELDAGGDLPALLDADGAQRFP